MLLNARSDAQAQIAELEASLATVLAERTTFERQRSAGKPPRPPTSGTSSPRAAPSSPFGRSTNGGGGDAAAGLQIASLEVQVRALFLSHMLPFVCTTMRPAKQAGRRVSLFRTLLAALTPPDSARIMQSSPGACIRYCQA